MPTIESHNRRVAVSVGLVVALAIGLALYVPARIDRSLHTGFEAVAATLALSIGLLALTRYRNESDTQVLFLGAAFIGTAAFDALHMALSHEVVAALPSSPSDIVAWSWFAGRMYLGIMLVAREIAGPRFDSPDAKKLTERSVFGLAMLIFVVALILFLVVPLPTAYQLDLITARPLELLPGALFAIVAGRMLYERRWRHDISATWLLAGVVLQVAAQIGLMTFSPARADAWFLGGHALKVIGYAAVLVALVLDINALYQKAEDNRSTLEWTNRHLARENERRRRVDLLLDTQRQMLESILDSQADPVLIVDPEGRIERSNRAAEEILGRGLVGRDLAGLAEARILADPSGNPLKKEDLAIFRALQGESVTQLHLLATRPRGKPRHVSVSSRPIIDRFGRRQGAVAIYRDVSEEIAARHEMEEANRELERRNRDLQDFAFIASHDLREPLRKVRAFGERLDHDYGEKLDERGRDYIGRMINAATRMSHLLDGLLDYSRVSTRSNPFEQVVLDDVVNDVLDDLEIRVRATNAEIDVGTLPVIEGDPVQLRQVFQNLIGNALKFTEPDERPQITIRSNRVERDVIQIVVEDQGIGIDPAQAERMFRPFQRLVARQDYEGHGMGLAIVRKIIERHGGTIHAEGAPGQGARFIMDLPLRTLPTPEALTHGN